MVLAMPDSLSLFKAVDNVSFILKPSLFRLSLGFFFLIHVYGDRPGRLYFRTRGVEFHFHEFAVLMNLRDDGMVLHEFELPLRRVLPFEQFLDLS